MTESNSYDMVDSTVCCDNGEVIFSEGSCGDKMYVIHSGRVEISRMSECGKQILAIIGAGSFFGEMALLNKTLRTATATALEPTTLHLLSKESMIARIENDPTFALNLITVLSERLINTTSKFIDQIETTGKKSSTMSQIWDKLDLSK